MRVVERIMSGSKGLPDGLHLLKVSQLVTGLRLCWSAKSLTGYSVHFQVFIDNPIPLECRASFCSEAELIRVLIFAKHDVVLLFRVGRTKLLARQEISPPEELATLTTSFGGF